MVQTPPNLDPLPPAPSTSSPSTFSVLMDAFLAALLLFRTQLVAIVANVFNNATEAFNAATIATAQAQAAVAVVGAAAFVPGKAYAKGDAVYSNVDSRTYRRLSAGSGTADPSADPTAWQCLQLSPLTRTLIVTSSGPVTIPATEFEIEMVGGPSGAAHGGQGGNFIGGSSAGYAKKRYTGATVGAVGTLTIGSVGAPGTATVAPTAGTASSFVLSGFGTVTCNGGTLTAGGTATGGDINIAGQRGGIRSVYSMLNNSQGQYAPTINGGNGASTPLGIGGFGNSGVGADASGYGAGASAGGANNDGIGSAPGAGSPAVMILRY